MACKLYPQADNGVPWTHLRMPQVVSACMHVPCSHAAVSSHCHPPDKLTRLTKRRTILCRNNGAKGRLPEARCEVNDIFPIPATGLTEAILHTPDLHLDAMLTFHH